VSEFSSIFLAITTLFQYHPPSSLLPPDSSLLALFGTIELLSQAMFVFTFFIFRIVGWVYATYRFLIDCRYVIQNKLVSRYKPGSGWFLWYLITISIVLSMLQIYWFGQIVEKVSICKAAICMQHYSSSDTIKKIYVFLNNKFKTKKRSHDVYSRRKI
jgi:hypothetical protein